MGAFFLASRGAIYDRKAVSEVFLRKGFSGAVTFVNKNWQLEIYPKILSCQVNYVTEGEITLSVCGTMLYKRSSPRKSLQLLLQDIFKGCVDRDEIAGHYVLFIMSANELHIVRDVMGVQKVFAFEGIGCYSSSFLALAFGAVGGLDIDRSAFWEKVVTGEIVGYRTLFRQITALLPGEFLDRPSWDTASYTPAHFDDDYSSPTAGRRAALIDCADSLRNAMLQWSGAHEELRGLLGVSDGYDSRLLLASSSALAEPLDLYTHHTVGAHDGVQSTAEQLAALYGRTLCRPISASLNSLPTELVEQTMLDTLYYFDGRSSRHRGALNYTFSSRYYRDVFSRNGLFFNGIGGEVFRNHTRSPQFISRRSWMERHVAFPFAADLLGDGRVVHEVLDSLEKEVDRRLGGPSDISASDSIRAYYTFVRLIDSDANIVSAHEQMVHVAVPFLDRGVLESAWRARIHLGFGSRFEADLIDLVEPGLGKLPYNDGRRDSFGRQMHGLLGLFKSFLPNNVFIRQRNASLRRSAPRKVNEFNVLKARVPLVNATVELLENELIGKPIGPVLYHFGQGPSTLYLGLLLHTLRDKIRSL